MLAGLLAIALWMASVPTVDPGPAAVKTPQQAVRTVLRDAPALPEEESAEPGAADPTSIGMAIHGELGLSMRNRVCRLCIAEMLDHEDCRRCGGYANAGRLVFDMVDLEGRPFEESATLVAQCAERYTGGPSGYIDLPPGPCKVAVLRFTSVFRSATRWVEVDITTDDETYELFEVASGPVGGVGVKLDYEDGAFRVIDLIGSYAGGRVPVGAEILAIDGQPAGLPVDPGVADPRSSLPGPVGTEVEVQIGYESEAGWVEETVLLERQAIGAHEIGLGGTPG